MKKGDMSVTNMLILAVIVGILLLVFTGKVANFFSDSGKTEVCKASILKASVVKDFSFGLSSSAPSCNDLPDVKITKLDDNAIKKQIADSMLACWSMVGKGNLDPYKEFGGKQKYCMICSDVIFEDIVEKADNQKYELKDMMYWLATHNVPGQKASYFETLYGIKPDTMTIKQMQGENKFDITQPYVVVWTTSKSDWTGLEAASITAGGAIAGGTVAAVILSSIPAATALTFLGPIGLAAGALTVAGAVGAYYIVKSGEETLATGVHVVPKSQLGNTVTIQNKDNKIHTSQFCTNLVNY